MIFLTALDDHPEPAPLGRRSSGHATPTIAGACGFSPRDYVPDPMTAPLGRFAYLAPDAPGLSRHPETDDPTAYLAATARIPRHWADLSGIAALGQFIVNDILSPCDRLARVTHSDAPVPAPLERAYVVARLGNLRHGRSDLDCLYGGACLQGSLAHAARRGLRPPSDPARLHEDRQGDLRNAAHPDLAQINLCLVRAHNAMAEGPDSDMRMRCAWTSLLHRNILPALCGPAAPGSDRPQHPGALPLESVFGPIALLPLALAGRPDDDARALLTALLRKCARLNLPSAEALIDRIDPAGQWPRVPSDFIPPEVAGACPLPLYLLAEAGLYGDPMFGPLGSFLLRTALAGGEARTPPPSPADGRLLERHLSAFLR